MNTQNLKWIFFQLNKCFNSKTLNRLIFFFKYYAIVCTYREVSSVCLYITIIQSSEQKKPFQNVCGISDISPLCGTKKQNNLLDFKAEVLDFFFHYWKAHLKEKKNKPLDMDLELGGLTETKKQTASHNI